MWLTTKKKYPSRTRGVLNTIENDGGVAFADLGDDDADRVTALLAQGLGHHVWLVFELLGCQKDALLCRCGHGARLSGSGS